MTRVQGVASDMSAMGWTSIFIDNSTGFEIKITRMIAVSNLSSKLAVSCF